MSVTNETLTGFEAPSPRNLIRMIAVVTGLVAGAVFAVSLATGSDAPAVDTPAVEASAAEPSRSIQAQIDRLNGIAGQYGVAGLTPAQRAAVHRWKGLAETYGALPATQAFGGEAQTWAGIELRYGTDAGSPSVLEAVDEFEAKMWRDLTAGNRYRPQDVLPDF
jgi:hypothetical protein